MITNTVMSTDSDEVTVTFKQGEHEATTTLSKAEWLEYVKPTLLGKIKKAFKALK